MREWMFLRSKCVFCAVSAARGGRVAPQSRAWYGTTTAARERDRSSATSKRKGPRRSSGSTIQQRGGPRISFGSGLGTSRDPRPIFKGLASVRERLAESGYDTTGPLWEQFSKEVHEAAGEGVLLDLDRALPKFQKEVVDAALKGSVDGYLLCAFIDRTLENRGHNVSKSLGQVADMRYPTEWYIKARSTQREIHLHIGPTNSGKTYNALKKLEEAGSGFYAGPLRLLAHEVYSRFKAKGLRCDLVTGDDVRLDEESDETKLTSSTVEMADVNTPVSVAVIDEIQMMADKDRGWAWTRAFIGSCAQEVHLCGESRVLPLVTELAASMGDKLEVHEYKRLNELKCMSNSLRGDLNKLRPGDAVVCFSIVGIHAMKKAIEERTGRRVAIVYGSLPPETRAQQAALFNEPDNDYDYLVASDAIGMGLNLSIKRVIFESVWKYNGHTTEQLSVPQIKQIAGRAGRYRTARDAAKKESSLDSRNPKETRSIGLVTTMEESDLPIVRAALETEAEPITTAGILPPGDFIEDFAARLPKNTPHDYVLRRLSEAAAVHPRFSLCGLRDQLHFARVIEPVKGMTTTERHIFTAAPFSFSGNFKQPGAMIARKLAECIGDRKPTCVADIPEIPLEILEQPLENSREMLHKLEFLHQSLILYLWLSYRMPTIFKDQEMAFHAKEMVEGRINTFLEKFTDARRAQRKQRKMAQKMAKLADTFPHDAGEYSGTRHVRLTLDGFAEGKSSTSGELLSDESVSEHEVLSEPGVSVGTINAPAENAALPIDWNRQVASNTLHDSGNKDQNQGTVGVKAAGDA